MRQHRGAVDAADEAGGGDVLYPGGELGGLHVGCVELGLGDLAEGACLVDDDPHDVADCPGDSRCRLARRPAAVSAVEGILEAVEELLLRVQDGQDLPEGEAPLEDLGTVPVVPLGVLGDDAEVAVGGLVADGEDGPVHGSCYQHHAVVGVQRGSLVVGLRVVVPEHVIDDPQRRCPQVVGRLVQVDGEDLELPDERMHQGKVV